MLKFEFKILNFDNVNVKVAKGIIPKKNALSLVALLIKLKWLSNFPLEAS